MTKREYKNEDCSLLLCDIWIMTINKKKGPLKEKGGWDSVRVLSLRQSISWHPVVTSFHALLCQGPGSGASLAQFSSITVLCLMRVSVGVTRMLRSEGWRRTSGLSLLYPEFPPILFSSPNFIPASKSPDASTF